ncbi:hypothetical protein NPIL_623671 [Nephila pilipes]|uniref:Uncharacterized protein n=1 Tax=Nephila pilipes TaxID=299642 RepID=A0A8X6U2A7_NEPPI|nr:hypothetical protein NPIL_623671 [Nephila pilipes]
MQMKIWTVPVDKWVALLVGALLNVISNVVKHLEKWKKLIVPADLLENFDGYAKTLENSAGREIKLTIVLEEVQRYLFDCYKTKAVVGIKDREILTKLVIFQKETGKRNLLGTNFLESEVVDSKKFVPRIFLFRMLVLLRQPSSLGSFRKSGADARYSNGENAMM